MFDIHVDDGSNNQDKNLKYTGDFFLIFPLTSQKKTGFSILPNIIYTEMSRDLDIFYGKQICLSSHAMLVCAHRQNGSIFLCCLACDRLR